MTKISLSFSTVEISTILAALANWEDHDCKSADDLVEQIATQDCRHPKQALEEVADLRGRIAEEATDQERLSGPFIRIGRVLQ